MRPHFGIKRAKFDKTTREGGGVTHVVPAKAGTYTPCRRMGTLKLEVLCNN
jgi:hypothetical protein